MLNEAFKYTVCVYMQVLATRLLQSQCNGALPHSHQHLDMWSQQEKSHYSFWVFWGFFAKATTTFNLLQPHQKHLQETVGDSQCEKAFLSRKQIPTDLRHTLWSTGLRPCAVFPFLLCCELSQSYSTSGLLRSLQNVHIHSPLNRNKHNYSRYPGTKSHR